MRSDFEPAFLISRLAARCFVSISAVVEQRPDRGENSDLSTNHMRLVSYARKPDARDRCNDDQPLDHDAGVEIGQNAIPNRLGRHRERPAHSEPTGHSDSVNAKDT